jgi:nucleotide-binding universal stress UspA family protein
MYSTPAPIVVGVDDSPQSRAALRFALREAVRRGSPLDVVTAWTWPSLTSVDSETETREPARALAQEVQDVALAEVLEDFDMLPILSRQVVEGDAGQVLLRIAKSADYLVVGSSRLSQPDGIQLGPVSDHCVRHATCPVLVVPEPVSRIPASQLMAAATSAPNACPAVAAQRHHSR